MLVLRERFAGGEIQRARKAIVIPRIPLMPITANPSMSLCAAPSHLACLHSFFVYSSTRGARCAPQQPCPEATEYSRMQSMVLDCNFNY